MWRELISGRKKQEDDSEVEERVMGRFTESPKQAKTGTGRVHFSRVYFFPEKNEAFLLGEEREFSFREK